MKRLLLKRQPKLWKHLSSQLPSILTESSLLSLFIAITLTSQFLRALQNRTLWMLLPLSLKLILSMQTTAHMQSKTAFSALLILHSQQKNLLLTAMSLLLRQLLISTLSSKKLLKSLKSRLLLLHSTSWKTALSLQHTNMTVLKLLS